MTIPISGAKWKATNIYRTSLSKGIYCHLNLFSRCTRISVPSAWYLKWFMEDRYCIVNFRNKRENIFFYLQNMIREIEAKAPGYETICQDLMEVLVIYLTRQTDFSTTMAPIKKSASRLCATVKRYIDEHFKENINLDMLAELTHSSKYYMVHAFSEEYGISPINYMISRRIEDAKQLLKNDDYSLALISRMLGFSSPSYFSQIFKKSTGMSPNEYRKVSRAQEPGHS